MNATATTAFKKGDTGFYTNSAGTFRVLVETVHRDGSVTVVALFPVGPDGKDRFGHLGFKYRMDADQLRTSV